MDDLNKNNGLNGDRHIHKELFGIFGNILNKEKQSIVFIFKVPSIFFTHSFNDLFIYIRCGNV